MKIIGGHHRGEIRNFKFEKKLLKEGENIK